jgi:hypothetical protein
MSRTLAAPVMLRWGFLNSFVEYVRAIEDGEIETYDSAEMIEKDYCFPYASTAGDARVHQFVGGLRLSGYGALLDIDISAPAILCTDDRSAALSLDVADGRGVKRVTVAELTFSEGDSSDREIIGLANLLREATFLFDGAYPAGHELDPVRVVLRD